MSKLNIPTQDKVYKAYIEKTIENYNNNGKKTIVYFCDTFYPIIDGVIKVLDNYAKGLSKKYNTIVIVPKHKNKYVVQKQDYLVIGTASMYFKFVNYDLGFPEADNYLKTIIKKIRIDLIHSHSPFNMGIYAAKLAKKLKVPLVMTSHSLYKKDFMRYTNSPAITDILLSKAMRVFNKSDEVWAMHDRGVSELLSYGYKGKTYLMPNATDYQIPQNEQQLSEKVNKKHNISQNQLVFLFVGRLVTQKNILFVVDILKRLKTANLDFKMIFVGSGPDEQDLKNYIKKQNLNPHIILTGQVENREELASYYSRADLFIFPSTYDNSSIVQIESAAYKTPGIFTKDSVTAATITDNQNGYLSEFDADAFANKILEICEDRNALKQVGLNAFNELYITWDQVIKKVADRYEYLIAKNKNRINKINAIKIHKQNEKKSKE